MTERTPYDDFHTTKDDPLRPEREEPQESRRERRSSKNRGGGLLEFVVILLVSFGLVFGFVRPFVVEAFVIPSESMVPTLEVGDRVLANKFVYRFAEPERGDVVVFRSVEGGEEDLIKRVVATEGQTVSVEDGTLLLDGVPQDDSYTNAELPDVSYSVPRTVPEDHVFVMGDNRANSRDSRVFGPVPEENIEGEAFVRFWPVTRLGAL
jgi:signal peptidase I